MEIVTRDNLSWSSEDVEQFLKFLETTAGKRLIPKLAEGAPTLLGAGQTNDILIRSGELRGYQAALQNLFSLSAVQPKQSSPADAYPSLDADEAWTNEQGQAAEKLQ